MFDNVPRQCLVLNTVDWQNNAPSIDERVNFATAATYRCTFRPGLLLNARELASLVHIPSIAIPSERLQRISSKTRPAVSVPAEHGSVVLGDNEHRGEFTQARISANLRPRHVYVVGQTGTGKSTLLLNLIMQEIESGGWAGLLDPHGDLCEAVLRRIPEDRLGC